MHKINKFNRSASEKVSIITLVDNFVFIEARIKLIIALMDKIDEICGNNNDDWFHENILMSEQLDVIRSDIEKFGKDLDTVAKSLRK
jgi:hypothetical protein